MRIMLDMDGVLVNFMEGIKSIYGYDDYEIPDHTYQIHLWTFYAEGNPFKISKKELREIFDYSSEFWVKLPEYSWSKELIKKCFNLVGPENVFILSAPSRGESCKGKFNWIEKNYPEMGDRYVLTPHKYLCAQDSVLIDDSDWKIDSFVEAGGHGIVFPQEWNSQHGNVGNRVKYVYSELERILNGFE